ncbi:MAG: PEGA domain-containing protein [Patescibacteria group bacterium]|nr:PEGA domain-containing protein [Patescibacteria group bacterium]MDE2014922.1 PEGA domain-containing protein [Patescibacteria group bacterium]MDE2226351.1 PEGA domain-containing protein [Patescibacteria group bacterium]
MTLSRRRRLFYLLLTAFFIIGGVVLLYVNGWRVDFKTLKLKKVGAIFVRSIPENSQITLDGREVQNKSGFLQNGTLINNLFPKSYNLKLSLPGYEDWHENVSVSPALVKEIKYAVLVPKTYQVVATGTIKDFQIFGNNLLTENGKGDLLIANRKIGNGGLIGWTNDFNYLLSENSSGVYYWNEIASGSAKNLNALLKKIGFSTAKKFTISVDPYDNRRLIVSQNNKFYLLDAERSLLINVYIAESGKTLGDKITASQYYLAATELSPRTNTSTIIIYDKFLQKIRSTPPELSGKNISLEWSGNNKLAILQSDGELYLYDVSSGNVPQKIADDVKNFAFTDDGSAIAALENSSLEVISLDPNGNYYRFNLPDVKNAIRAFWYGDSQHLFIAYPGRTMFLDLGDDSLVNFIQVADSNSSQYEAEGNTLYFLRNDAIYSLKFSK